MIVTGINLTLVLLNKNVFYHTLIDVTEPVVLNLFKSGTHLEVITLREAHYHVWRTSSNLSQMCIRDRL